MIRFPAGAVDYFEKCLDLCFPDVFALEPPFWLRKITTDPDIIADVDKGYPDYWYPELQICISGMILYGHQYIAVAYVTVHCMI